MLVVAVAAAAVILVLASIGIQIAQQVVHVRMELIAFDVGRTFSQQPSQLGMVDISHDHKSRNEASICRYGNLLCCDSGNAIAVGSQGEKSKNDR